MTNVTVPPDKVRNFVGHFLAEDLFVGGELLQKKRLPITEALVERISEIEDKSSLSKIKCLPQTLMLLDSVEIQIYQETSSFFKANYRKWQNMVFHKGRHYLESAINLVFADALISHAMFLSILLDNLGVEDKEKFIKIYKNNLDIIGFTAFLTTLMALTAKTFEVGTIEQMVVGVLLYPTEAIRRLQEAGKTRLFELDPNIYKDSIIPNFEAMDTIKGISDLSKKVALFIHAWEDTSAQKPFGANSSFPIKYKAFKINKISKGVPASMAKAARSFAMLVSEDGPNFNNYYALNVMKEYISSIYSKESLELLVAIIDLFSEKNFIYINKKRVRVNAFSFKMNTVSFLDEANELQILNLSDPRLNPQSEEDYSDWCYL